jgi:hypothetical protein
MSSACFSCITARFTFFTFYQCSYNPTTLAAVRCQEKCFWTILLWLEILCSLRYHRTNETMLICKLKLNSCFVTMEFQIIQRWTRLRHPLTVLWYWCSSYHAIPCTLEQNWDVNYYKFEMFEIWMFLRVWVSLWNKDTCCFAGQYRCLQYRFVY